MRIAQSEIYRNFLSDIEALSEHLNRLSRQLSSGKKLTNLKDSPAASAELVGLSERASVMDQYSSNVDTGMYFLRVADSALSEVQNLVTSIYAKGSQATSEIIVPNARATLAAEIRSLRDQVLSIANSEARGRYIFAGSMVTEVPFGLDGDSISYSGDSEASLVRVDNGTEVMQCVPGSLMFTSIFSAVEELLSAVDGNDLSAIKAALEQFVAALSGLNQVRGQIGANMGLLENLKVSLDIRRLNVQEQRSRLEDADLAEVVVRLSQNQTALEAAMRAGGSILQQPNLFDILV